MDNQIHFEQTPYHHVYLKDRKTLELTGIKKIESFDSLEFLIETSLGYLNIKVFRSYKIKRESFAYKNNFSYICTSIKTYTVSYTKDSVIILCPINGFLKFEIMDLITQIQGMGYSFVYGIIFTFVYHFIYSHLIKIKIKFIYFIMQCCFGIIFAAIYFIGLLKINEGILRAYFLVSVLAGYVVYQNLMHEKMYIMIVKINQKLTRLFKPVRFVFLKFDGIIGSIKKRVKR